MQNFRERNKNFFTIFFLGENDGEEKEEVEKIKNLIV
jgi:hypothetical protein